MIKVTLRNNITRTSVILDENTTLRNALEQNEIDYSRGTLHLDGASLRPGDLDKTFAELGVTERCFLLQISKMDNAL